MNKLDLGVHSRDTACLLIGDLLSQVFKWASLWPWLWPAGLRAYNTSTPEKSRWSRVRNAFSSPHKHIKNKTTCKTTLTEINLKTSRTSLPQPSLYIKVQVESGRKRGEACPWWETQKRRGSHWCWNAPLGVRGLHPILGSLTQSLTLERLAL